MTFYSWSRTMSKTSHRFFSCRNVSLTSIHDGQWREEFRRNFYGGRRGYFPWGKIEIWKIPVPVDGFLSRRGFLTSNIFNKLSSYDIRQFLKLNKWYTDTEGSFLEIDTKLAINRVPWVWNLRREKMFRRKFKWFVERSCFLSPFLYTIFL